MSLIKKIGFWTAFIIPMLVIIGFYSGSYFNLITPFFVFIVIPLADYLIGEDPENMEENKARVISEEFYYRFITYIWAVFQFLFVIWSCYVIATSSLTTFESIAFTFSFALVTGGIGITVAHELGHKKSKLERFYSRLILMTVSYMHFYIEHNRAHHVYVATPRDPATSRKGEHFYKFWVRSVFNGYISAWKLENSKLERKGKTVISLSNEMIWYSLLPLAFCAILTLVAWQLGYSAYWSVPLFFIAQSILAFSLLEIVNYVEHYGIVRKEISPGKYERVNPGLFNRIDKRRA